MNNQSRVCEICSKETKKLGTHLRVEHKMTSEEYYNKYLSEDHGGKCPFKDCNNMRPYRSMEVGYRQFCSKSCASKHNQDQPKLKEILRERNKTLMKERHADPEFAKAHSERMSKRLSAMHKDPEFAKDHSKRASDRTPNLHRKYFDKMCEQDKVENALFYIYKNEEYLKIGITRIVENNLSHLYHRIGGNNVPHESFIGNYSEISKFEEFIKLEFNSIKGKEFFPLDLYEEIKSKIPNTILPYSTLVV